MNAEQRDREIAVLERDIERLRAERRDAESNLRSKYGFNRREAKAADEVHDMTCELHELRNAVRNLKRRKVS